MNNSRSIKEQFSREHYVVYIAKTNHPSLKGLLVIITPMPFFHGTPACGTVSGRVVVFRQAKCVHCVTTVKVSPSRKINLNIEMIHTVALALYTVATKLESRAFTGFAPMASQL